MPWLWRIHGCLYFYPYSSSQRNTGTHCHGCHNSLVACSKCTVHELYIVCSVKNSFVGCEEEGCLPCCCCYSLAKEEKGDQSPAKGWPRRASRGTVMTGDREERGRNHRLRGQLRFKETSCEVKPRCSGIYPSGALQQSLWNEGEKENCPRVLLPQKLCWSVISSLGARESC